MSGWIKINRSIGNHWLWQDAERLKWWLDLLLMASWGEKQVLHDSHLTTLQRGQMIASISFLSDRWGKSKPTIIRFLRLLEEEGMIKRSTLYRQTSILTVCNYERYQCEDDPGLYTQVDTIVDRQNDENVRCKVDKPISEVSIIKSDGLGYKDETKVDTIVDRQVDTIVDTNKEYKELINININNNSPEKKFEIEELKKEQLWLEAMAMRYNCSSTQEIIQWLDVFSLDVQCRDSRHRSMSDMKRHFCDWLRIQLEKKNKEKVINHGNQGKYSQRRGSEVTAASSKDFKGSF